MATMVPPVAPASATPGEKLFFRILERLPPDVHVYFDKPIRQRYPDFTIISPRQGVLTVEIKDWSIHQIEEADRSNVCLRGRNQTHPVKRARDYAHALMDEVLSRLEGRLLLEPGGPYKGRILFPVGHLAGLANITRAELCDAGMEEIFEPARTLTRDEALKLPSDPAALEHALDRFYAPKWKFMPLDRAQVDQLRGIIHPHIVVRTISEKIIDSEMSYLMKLKVLDSEQEQRARSIGPGHRLLFGVSGSGKTTILMARAQYLARQNPMSRGLVVCFNRPLAAYLKKYLASYDNVDTKTFLQLAHAHGIPWDGPREAIGTMLAEVLSRSAQRFDFILVDEAQDFDPSWLRCVVLLLRDQENCDLFITGDGSQKLYGRRSFSWKSLGIHAQGRTEYLRFNYRNGRNIFRYAARFAGDSSFGQLDQSESLKADAELTRGNKGKPVLIVGAKSRKAEIDRALALVSGLLAGKWGNRTQPGAVDPPVQPEDIGIIYASHKPDGLCDLIEKELVPGLRALCGGDPVWLSSPHDKSARDLMDRPGVKIQTIHHAKGLQYRAVLFLWADLLPFSGNGLDEEDRSLFYVALTRAGEFLAVLHSASSPLIDEFRQVADEAE